MAAFTRGVAMGQEHKGKGVNIALGPMMNLGRSVVCKFIDYMRFE